jgi:1-acyl-sn-glycerol-3-phosphate acyltransferase
MAAVLRSMLATAFVVVYSMLCACAAVLSRLVDRSGDLVCDLARIWGVGILKAAGVSLEVDGRVVLDPRQPYVFMANHLSAMDIWAVLAAVPVRLRFIAKKQLASIPFVGWAIWAGRFIFIDRKNAARAKESIEEAKRRIRAGSSVILFPEGTRSRDGKMLPFKKGGVHLALDTGVPIVPVAIWGTFEAMPKGKLLVPSARVKVIIGAPIATAGHTEADRDRLLGKVRRSLAELVGEMAPASVEDVLAEPHAAELAASPASSPPV